MKRWPALVAGLAAYGLGLLFMAPAALLDARLDQATAGRVRLAEARGTLWSGNATLEVRDANLQAGIARPLAWSLRPAYLLLGQLRYALVLDPSGNTSHAAFSPAGAEISNAVLRFPASALGLAEPRLAALELTGELQLQVTLLSVERGKVRGAGTLQWRAAGSALAPVAPLGDYEMQLEGDGGALRATLRTLQGPLQLAGQGAWTPGTRPEFSATARVPPQHQQQLGPLLRLIAVDRGDGVFVLQLK